MATKRKVHEAFTKAVTNGAIKKKTLSTRTEPVVAISAFAAARARSKQFADDEQYAEQGEIDTSREEDCKEVSDRNHLNDNITSTPPSELRGSQPTTIKDELTLRQDETITILGEYELEVQSGSVIVYGATLHPKSGKHRVYAFSTHALPQIVAKTDTKLRITPVSSVDKLAELSPLFRNISSGSLEISSGDRLPLETPKQYQHTLTQLAMKAEQGHISVACVGGKSTGKSTFTRHICNKLLTRTSIQKCMVLDLDPGQPEFGPPGQIYLVEVSSPIFGPSYTHFASEQSKEYRLIAAHTIAATSFKDDPQHYIDAVRALFSRARGTLVVNTCGWITGLGVKILGDILSMVSDVVVIDNIDITINPGINIYNIDRPTARYTTRSPTELRQMQTMAYFHSRNGKPINQWRPWLVSFDSIKIKSYGQQPSLHFMHEVLDGAIVALTIADSVDAIEHTAEGLPCSEGPLNPRTSRYLGLALIRGIDISTKQLQLLTPLTTTQIAALSEESVYLVRGSFDSPDWAYLEGLKAGEEMDGRPWLTRRTMIGVEGAVWRLRHPPSRRT